MQIEITKRVIKQVIIGGIYLLLFSVALVFIFTKAKPAKVKPPEESLFPLEAVGVKAIRSEGSSFNILFQLKNPNLSWGARVLKYKISAYDKNDNIISERDGRDFILPNETKYIFALNWYLDKPLGQIKVKIGPSSWEMLNENYYDWLKVYNLRANFSVPPEVGYLYAEGTVRNNSPFDLKNIIVKVILKDKKGKIIGIGKTVLYDILAKDSRYFKVIWRSPFEGIKKSDIDLSSLEVYPESNFLLYR